MDSRLTCLAWSVAVLMCLPLPCVCLTGGNTTVAIHACCPTMPADHSTPTQSPNGNSICNCDADRLLAERTSEPSERTLPAESAVAHASVQAVASRRLHSCGRRPPVDGPARQSLLCQWRC